MKDKFRIERISLDKTNEPHSKLQPKYQTTMDIPRSMFELPDL